MAEAADEGPSGPSSEKDKREPGASSGEAEVFKLNPTPVTVAELRAVRRQSANPAYRAAAEALAAGKTAGGLAKLDAMGAVVEIDNPTARRVRMVDEWFAATQETKCVPTKSGTAERAKTALMVAPTWVEIDALIAHAREKLRAAGQIMGADHTFPSLRAKDWTKAQQKDARVYRAPRRSRGAQSYQAAGPSIAASRPATGMRMRF